MTRGRHRLAGRHEATGRPGERGAEAGAALGRRDLEAELGQAADAGGQREHGVVVALDPVDLHVAADRQRVAHPGVGAQVGPDDEPRLGCAGPLGEEHGIEHVDPAVVAGETGHDARVVGVAPAVEVPGVEVGVGDPVGGRHQRLTGDGDHGEDAVAPRGDPGPRAVDVGTGAAPGAQQQVGDGMAGSAAAVGRGTLRPRRPRRAPGAGRSRPRGGRARHPGWGPAAG